MILRFEVDQAEAFRRGVNVPKSTNHIDVDPAELRQEERDLIADRLDGIDVCELGKGGGKLYNHEDVVDPKTHYLVDKQTPVRIKAKLPTFEALMEAIRENQAAVDKEKADEAKFKQACEALDVDAQGNMIP